MSPLLDLGLVVVVLLVVGAPLATQPKGGAGRGFGLVCAGLCVLIALYVVLHLARL
ncbi:MAG: hypothetical protein JO202_18420 [Ktedonobacteraceae bacterium]|nr:hypothetical protein [Ktedonobacteraceae bacterium]